ncbi:MAG: prepilin-type N-terminal cleavage/methylation domain-containing protein [Planctomycetota bacterium]
MKNHQITQSPNRPIRRSRSGFTLIEAALTMVIVGVGILAMVSAQQAYHQKNDWAQRTGTAQMLANEIRELTLSLPHHDPISGSATLGPESNESSAAGPQTDVANYDDLDDFAGTVTGAGYGSGVTFNPPINGLRLAVDGLDQWSQSVTVENVFPDNLAAGGSDVQPLGSTNMMRVTVDVLYQQSASDPIETITSMTWVVAR